MSKRFGRNRKRRMRAQIEELIVAYKAMNFAYEHSKAINYELQEEINRAKRILGPYFLGFKPEIISMNYGFDPSEKVMLIPHERSQEVSATSIMPQSTIESVPLDVMAAEVHPEAIKHELHARIMYADQKFAYGIQARSLALHGIDFIKKVVAPEIARMLVLEIQKTHKGFLFK